MRFKNNEKYLSIAIYAFLVLAASIVFYLVVSEVSGVFSHLKVFTTIFTPITIGFVMAYLFNFILKMYENRITPKLNLKIRFQRFVGVFLTYITVLILLLLFLQFILPQLLSSLIGLVNDIPNHVRNISNMFYDLSGKFEFTDEFNAIITERFNYFTNYVISLSSDIVPKLANITRMVLSSVLNIILGLVISIYVLIDKEKFAGQFRKMTNAILPLKAADKTMELIDRANNIFGNFLSGKILDSSIVAVLTFVILIIFKIPYALLVAFIIGVSNIIPFFGPFIGAIPAFFIILFVSPQKALLFLLLIFIIQQIDGNIIGPKILGDSLGISPFWILFSLLISGKVFGFVGLIIGVPLFVFIYSIIKELVELRLKQKGLPIETSAYHKE
ncbi:MAG: AI-2E family transporter [Erysipelothrix sp.]|nr:AI-2E family transporter [Erysipelothrix sp.]